MKKIFIFVVASFVMMACEKSQDVELNEIYSADQGSNLIPEFNYDVSDIPGIIKLADPQLYKEMYTQNDGLTRSIEVGWDGIWFGDVEAPFCLAPANLCYIIITADADSRGPSTLIKALPEEPVAVTVNNVETVEKDGVTYVIYE